MHRCRKNKMECFDFKWCKTHMHTLKYMYTHMNSLYMLISCIGFFLILLLLLLWTALRMELRYRCRTTKNVVSEVDAFTISSHIFSIYVRHSFQIKSIHGHFIFVWSSHTDTHTHSLFLSVMCISNANQICGTPKKLMKTKYEIMTSQMANFPKSPKQMLIYRQSIDLPCCLVKRISKNISTSWDS